MSNEISQNNTFASIALQDVKNSEVHITQYLGKSAEYEKLIEELNYQKEVLAAVPEENIELRITASKKINELEKEKEQFELSVLLLAEQFRESKVTSDRLEKAKALFDEGEFSKGYSLLQNDIAQILEEQQYLLAERRYYQETVENRLIKNSEELLILALSVQFDFSNPNRFEDTCRYFEASIDSYVTEDNLFLYAYFLQMHNLSKKAEHYYRLTLEKFDAQMSLGKKATVYNNLGNLLGLTHRLEQAEDYLNQALNIRQKLADDNEETPLHAVAATLSSLAKLNSSHKDYVNELKNLEAALSIFQELAAENARFLIDVAITTKNIATVYSDVGRERGDRESGDREMFDKSLEYFNEALEYVNNLSEQERNSNLHFIGALHFDLALLFDRRREAKKGVENGKIALEIYQFLAKENPRVFLRYHAEVLNVLGGLYADLGKIHEAESHLLEAFEIIRELAKDDAQIYLPEYGRILANMAHFYWRNKPEKEKSINFAFDCIVTLLPYVERIPAFVRYYANAMIVLHSWGIFKDEIDKVVFEKTGSFPVSIAMHFNN